MPDLAGDDDDTKRRAAVLLLMADEVDRLTAVVDRLGRQIPCDGLWDHGPWAGNGSAG
jgi:hypothetical protein